MRKHFKVKDFSHKIRIDNYLFSSQRICLFKIVNNSKSIQILKFFKMQCVLLSTMQFQINLKLMTALSITKKLVQNALYEIEFYDPDKSTE